MADYDPYDGATQIQPNQQSEESGNPDKSLTGDQKKAVGAAAVGTAALGGAAYALSRLEDGENGDQADGTGTDTDGMQNQHGTGQDDLAHTGNTTPPVTPPVNPPVDPNAGTGLTGFDKAFAEARLAMGPGHTFEYEGETYNTYTKEEEAVLTPEERNEFLASNNLLPNDHGHGHGAGQHHAPDTAIASTDPDNFPQVTIDDTPTTNTAVSHVSDEPDVSVATFEGHDIILLDTNHDHEAEVILADDGSVLLDTDGDHQYDTQGYYNPDTHQIENLRAVDQPLGVVAMTDHEPDYESMDDAEDLANDFDNHADVSDFT